MRTAPLSIHNLFNYCCSIASRSRYVNHNSPIILYFLTFYPISAGSRPLFFRFTRIPANIGTAPARRTPTIPKISLPPCSVSAFVSAAGIHSSVRRPGISRHPLSPPGEKPPPPYKDPHHSPAQDRLLPPEAPGRPPPPDRQALHRGSESENNPLLLPPTLP